MDVQADLKNSEENINSNWSFQNRQEYINRLKKEYFELIIIGGGITGAGIAREAALRGIKTALIDKNDFASGTSSRSSKLVHGGLRYIGYGEFKLVREATTERNWLRNDFPNLIRPVAFNLLSYRDGKLTPFEVKTVVKIYDFLSDFMSKFKNYKKREILKSEEFSSEEPSVRSEGLLVCGKYYDTNVDDARLTIETIKESSVIGDIIPVDYIKVNEILSDQNVNCGVKVTDGITGENFEIKGSNVVGATGIWTDELLKFHDRRIIRPTKGVHVVVKRNRLGNNNTIALNSIDDGRTFFIIDREELSIIGTTDTDYEGNLDEPFCDKEDCDYVFRTVNHYFPNANLQYDDIISTYAGIRPLVLDTNASDESAISRKHIIIDKSENFTIIAGGKLTTFRKMAEDLILHLILNKKSLTQKFPKKSLKKNFSKKPYLIALKRSQWDSFIQNKKPNLPDNILNSLYRQYGKGSFEILDLIQKDSSMGVPFLDDHPFIPAEIHYIMKHEFVSHLIDVLCRRTEISFKVSHKRQKKITEKVAEILSDFYGWSESKKSEEIQRYLDYISKTIWF